MVLSDVKPLAPLTIVIFVELKKSLLSCFRNLKAKEGPHKISKGREEFAFRFWRLRLLLTQFRSSYLLDYNLLKFLVFEYTNTKCNKKMYEI